MDLLGSGYGKVLLVVVEGCSAATVFPQTRHVRLVKLLSCLGDPPLPFLPQANQGQAMETCESAQTDDCTGNHPRSTSKPMVRHVLEDSSGDGYRRPGTGLQTALKNWVSPPKKSPKKPINRVCLGEESTDEPCQKAAQQIEADGGFRRHPRQGANVKSTWSGCEVKLGTCHMSHTRVPWKGHRRRQRVCGGDPYPRGLSDETTSLG